MIKVNKDYSNYQKDNTIEINLNNGLSPYQIDYILIDFNEKIKRAIIQNNDVIYNPAFQNFMQWVLEYRRIIIQSRENPAISVNGPFNSLPAFYSCNQNHSINRFILQEINNAITEGVNGNKMNPKQYYTPDQLSNFGIEEAYTGEGSICQQKETKDFIKDVIIPTQEAYEKFIEFRQVSVEPNNFQDNFNRTLAETNNQIKNGDYTNHINLIKLKTDDTIKLLFNLESAIDTEENIIEYTVDLSNYYEKLNFVNSNIDSSLGIPNSPIDLVDRNTIPRPQITQTNTASIINNTYNLSTHTSIGNPTILLSTLRNTLNQSNNIINPSPQLLDLMLTKIYKSEGHDYAKYLTPSEESELNNKTITLQKDYLEDIMSSFKPDARLTIYKDKYPKQQFGGSNQKISVAQSGGRSLDIPVILDETEKSKKEIESIKKDIEKINELYKKQDELYFDNKDFLNINNLKQKNDFLISISNVINLYDYLINSNTIDKQKFSKKLNSMSSIFQSTLTDYFNQTTNIPIQNDNTLYQIISNGNLTINQIQNLFNDANINLIPTSDPVINSAQTLSLLAALENKYSLGNFSSIVNSLNNIINPPLVQNVNPNKLYKNLQKYYNDLRSIQNTINANIYDTDNIIFEYNQIISGVGDVIESNLETVNTFIKELISVMQKFDTNINYLNDIRQHITSSKNRINDLNSYLKEILFQINPNNNLNLLNLNQFVNYNFDYNFDIYKTYITDFTEPLSKAANNIIKYYSFQKTLDYIDIRLNILNKYIDEFTILNDIIPDDYNTFKNIPKDLLNQLDIPPLFYDLINLDYNQRDQYIQNINKDYIDGEGILTYQKETVALNLYNLKYEKLSALYYLFLTLITTNDLNIDIIKNDQFLLSKLKNISVKPYLYIIDGFNNFINDNKNDYIQELEKYKFPGDLYAYYETFQKAALSSLEIMKNQHIKINDDINTQIKILGNTNQNNLTYYVDDQNTRINKPSDISIYNFNIKKDTFITSKQIKDIKQLINFGNDLFKFISKLETVWKMIKKFKTKPDEAISITNPIYRDREIEKKELINALSILKQIKEDMKKIKIFKLDYFNDILNIDFDVDLDPLSFDFNTKLKEKWKLIQKLVGTLYYVYTNMLINFIQNGFIEKIKLFIEFAPQEKLEDENRKLYPYINKINGYENIIKTALNEKKNKLKDDQNKFPIDININSDNIYDYKKYHNEIYTILALSKNGFNELDNLEKQTEKIINLVNFYNTFTKKRDSIISEIPDKINKLSDELDNFKKVIIDLINSLLKEYNLDIIFDIDNLYNRVKDIKTTNINNYEFNDEDTDDKYKDANYKSFLILFLIDVYKIVKEKWIQEFNNFDLPNIIPIETFNDFIKNDIQLGYKGNKIDVKMLFFTNEQYEANKELINKTDITFRKITDKVKSNLLEIFNNENENYKELITMNNKLVEDIKETKVKIYDRIIKISNANDVINQVMYNSYYTKSAYVNSNKVIEYVKNTIDNYETVSNMINDKINSIDEKNNKHILTLNQINNYIAYRSALSKLINNKYIIEKIYKWMSFGIVEYYYDILDSVLYCLDSKKMDDMSEIELYLYKNHYITLKRCYALFQWLRQDYLPEQQINNKDILKKKIEISKTNGDINSVFIEFQGMRRFLDEYSAVIMDKVQLHLRINDFVSEDYNKEIERYGEKGEFLLDDKPTSDKYHEKFDEKQLMFVNENNKNNLSVNFDLLEKIHKFKHNGSTKNYELYYNDTWVKMKPIYKGINFERIYNTNIFPSSDVISNYMSIAPNIKNNKGTVIMTYGYSGVGKSASLFGSKTTNGILQATMDQFSDVRIYLRVYEIYGLGAQYNYYWNNKCYPEFYQYIIHRVLNTTGASLTIDDNILFGNQHDMLAYILDLKDPKNGTKFEVNNTYNNSHFFNGNKFNGSTYVKITEQHYRTFTDFIKNLDKVREDGVEIQRVLKQLVKQIKGTVNNPISSRSILVYDFEVNLDPDTDIYTPFLIYDLPGKEDITKTYIDTGITNTMDANVKKRVFHDLENDELKDKKSSYITNPLLIPIFGDNGEKISKYLSEELVMNVELENKIVNDILEYEITNFNYPAPNNEFISNNAKYKVSTLFTNQITDKKFKSLLEKTNYKVGEDYSLKTGITTSYLYYNNNLAAQKEMVIFILVIIIGFLIKYQLFDIIIKIINLVTGEETNDDNGGWTISKIYAFFEAYYINENIVGLLQYLITKILNKESSIQDQITINEKINDSINENYQTAIRYRSLEIMKKQYMKTVEQDYGFVVPEDLIKNNSNPLKQNEIDTFKTVIDMQDDRSYIQDTTPIDVANSRMKKFINFSNIGTYNNNSIFRSGTKECNPKEEILNPEHVINNSLPNKINETNRPLLQDFIEPYEQKISFYYLFYVITNGQILNKAEEQVSLLNNTMPFINSMNPVNKKKQCALKK